MSKNIIIELMLINLTATLPPMKKKRKVEKDKRSKGEKAMDKAVESFVNYQKDAEERFKKWEDERWKKELELEEKRRREDREHEVTLFQMLGQMLKPRDRDSYNNTYSGPPYDFEY